jgi:hypothetical protein
METICGVVSDDCKCGKPAQVSSLYKGKDAVCVNCSTIEHEEELTR